MIDLDKRFQDLTEEVHKITGKNDFTFSKQYRYFFYKLAEYNCSTISDEYADRDGFDAPGGGWIFFLDTQFIRHDMNTLWGIWRTHDYVPIARQEDSTNVAWLPIYKDNVVSVFSPFSPRFSPISCVNPQEFSIREFFEKIILQNRFCAIENPINYGTFHINYIECDFCNSKYEEDKIVKKRLPDGTICSVCQDCCKEYDLSDWETVGDEITVTE